MDIKKRVWRFRDGSSVEFDTANKAITNHGEGLSVPAILALRDAMPLMMRFASGQDELDELIAGAFDEMIKRPA